MIAARLARLDLYSCVTLEIEGGLKGRFREELGE